MGSFALETDVIVDGAADTEITEDAHPASTPDCAVLIPTFLRPEHLKRCILSFHTRHPDLPIIVGDQSDLHDDLMEWCADHGVIHVPIAFDAGLSAVRNTLIGIAQTPYVLLTDDDMLFPPTFDLEKLLAVVQTGHFDLCAARVRHCDTSALAVGHIQQYEYDVEFRRDGGIFFPEANRDLIQIVERVPVRAAAVTANVFAARREAVEACRWDIELKITHEHYDWGMRFQQYGFLSCYAVEVFVDHDRSSKDADRRYAGLRVRNSKEAFFRKWGCTYFEVQGGMRVYRDAYTAQRLKAKAT